MRPILVAFSLVFCFALQSAKAIEENTDPRIRALEERLRCLVCQNQSLADSNAELAADLRRQVREQVKAGRSDAEIVDFLVQRYGDFVLYDPPFKASTLLLWTGPFVLFAIALATLVAVLRRRRAAPEDPALVGEERRIVEQVLGPSPQDRESR